MYHVRKKGEDFMKILIVEDEPSLRELIQRSLEKERYVVEAAGDFKDRKSTRLNSSHIL